MKTYFVCSDIHSFYNEWMTSIKNAGFEKENKNHILVIAGDLFDRGDQSLECLNFVKEMTKAKRLIYIWGNHEYLLIDCLRKNFPQHHDFTNGTVKTICHLAGQSYEEFEDWGGATYGEVIQRWNKLVNKINALGIVDFLNKNCIHYLEIENYIITHGFIPLRLKNIDKPTESERIYSANSEYEYNPNWRKDTTNGEWFGSTWFNPIERYNGNFFEQEAKNNKFLIVGHWGAFLVYKEYEGGIKKHHDIYKHENMICIDGTTVLSHQVNCFVIKED